MKNARWVRLADDLTRGITNGDYPLDSYLPTEMELCEKYNVSRYTVRLALADLTRMGLIKRWPRLGSKVVSVGFDETYAHTYTSFADIDGLSSTHKRVVQGTQECVVDHVLPRDWNARGTCASCVFLMSEPIRQTTESLLFGRPFM
jgi:GntR family transcriptional regulator